MESALSGRSIVKKHHLELIGKPEQNAVIPKAICLHISALPVFQWPPLSSETSSTEMPGDIARYGFGCQNIPRHNFLEAISQRCQFAYWFFGHYHENRIIDQKYILQWEKISELSF